MVRKICVRRLGGSIDFGFIISAILLLFVFALFSHHSIHYQLHIQVIWNEFGVIEIVHVYWSVHRK